MEYIKQAERVAL